MSKEYYIFGLQRSGTNFLEVTLQRNFNITKVNRTTKSWKHGIDLYNDTRPEVPKIVIYKNPYTWIESITTRNNVDWLKTQRTYNSQEGPHELRIGPHNMNVQQLAKTYVHWYQSWIKTDIMNRHIVRYEDLLKPETRTDILEEIRDKFNLRRRDDRKNWIIPQNGTVSQSKDYNEKRRQYYLKMRPENMTRVQIDAVNEVIPDSVFGRLEYKKI